MAERDSALLSDLVSALFKRLASQEVLNFLRPKEVIRKLLKKLKVLMWSAGILADDAEEKLISDPWVKMWHNGLKDVVYKANELADKIETEALRRKPERNITKMFMKLYSNPFDNSVKDELEEILSSLEHLLSQKDALGLEHVKTGVSERFRHTPVADESGFYGREEIKDTIFRSLRSACDERIAFIPIIGAGGIGKTTLAQIIYDHPEVKFHFGARAWVTISTEFDLRAITKRIIGQVNDSSRMDGNMDQQELLFKLRDALKGKKFLLVLDDVWSEDHDEWNNLKSCFNSGDQGSKIIVTTRSTRVASIAAPNQSLHFLPELHEEDCWRLFDHTVFTSYQDWEEHPDLREIGKKIVEKCKGLPLTVKFVGGILRGDRDAEKWESILKISVWELLQKNSRNIIPSLWLSYRYLPSLVKRCFAYCSIFPKGYVFQKEELVQLWMAEGFLKNEAEITMEDVGKHYLEELISRSLFQRSSDDEETIMMHDLVHDLAMYVSGEFCFCLDEDKILRDLALETRHLSYNLAIEDGKKFEGLSKAKRLHSFVGLPPQSVSDSQFDILKVLEEFSEEGACLRVLSLSSCFKIDSLPNSVGKLKHLRYLNLSQTSVTKLPDSIGRLYNLQTLLLSRCRNLTRLPNNLGNLINLHYLDTRGSPLEEMPPNMCELKKLHTLTDFVLGIQSGSGIKDLGVLKNLHGMIRVSGLQNVNNVDDASKANLKNKKNLSALTLEWGGQSDERDSRHEEKVLEALQPHANLKKLFISKYEGTRFPEWVGDSLFSKIETVHLNNCGKIEMWPEGGLPSNLESLSIWRCKKLAARVMHWDLQTVTPCLKSFSIDGCGEELLDSFPPEVLLPTSLTSLDICNFRGLKNLNIHVFQRLEKLLVIGCNELQYLPEESLPNSLSYLEIIDCPLLERRYQKETGEGWHKISHIPNVMINAFPSPLS